MNKNQAKKELLRSRKGRFDPEDVEFNRAVELSQSDGELLDWWIRQQAVNGAIADRFRKLEVPESLPVQIASQYQKTVSYSKWRRFSAPAIAAAIALLLALIFYQVQPIPAKDFESFRDRMARTVIREYRMDLNSNDLGEIRRFLAGNQGHPDFHVHRGLESTTPIGAGKLTWNGEPVSMVCFEKEADQMLFLFVIDREDLSGTPGDSPEFQPVSHLATASWSHSGKTYVLASQAGMDDLRARIGN